MKDTCATRVFPLEEFREDSSSCWLEVRQEAAQGMRESVQVLSHLTFCESLDQHKLPVSACQQGQAKYAVLSITMRDLGFSTDLADWEPLCEKGVSTA